MVRQSVEVFVMVAYFTKTTAKGTTDRERTKRLVALRPISSGKPHSRTDDSGSLLIHASEPVTLRSTRWRVVLVSASFLTARGITVSACSRVRIGAEWAGTSGHIAQGDAGRRVIYFASTVFKYTAASSGRTVLIDMPLPSSKPAGVVSRGRISMCHRK